MSVPVMRAVRETGHDSAPDSVRQAGRAVAASARRLASVKAAWMVARAVKGLVVVFRYP